MLIIKWYYYYMPNKPRIDILPHDNATASGVVPTWDGTYLFDDPVLFFDRLYPGNISHSGAEKPRINNSQIY